MATALQRTATALDRLSRFINGKLFLLALIATGAMAVPTTIDVAGAFFFNRSLACSIELVEFLQVVLVFGSLGFVHDQRGHIYVEMLVDRLPARVRSAVRLALMGTATVLFCFMAWRLALSGLDKMHGGEVSYSLHLPVFAFIFFAALGAASTALSLLADVVSTLADLLSDRSLPALLAGLAGFALLASLPYWLPGFEWTHDKLIFGSVCMAFLMVLLLLGMPIGIAMLGVGFGGLLVVYPSVRPALSLLGSAPYSTGATYLYSVVPMFILMGELAMYSGISRDLFQAANVWLGRLPGGLAVATVTGCAGFAAVSGDSMATAVTMASVALPEMRKKKYDPGLACATLAAGGTLGILIPPSTGFIFYSLVTEVSIGKLFMAGIIPGLILAAFFILVVLFFAWRRPELAPRGESSTMGEKLRALLGVLPMVLLITLVLGGILFGAFSPNQGGAVGAVGTFLYALARRRLSWTDFKNALISTASVTAKVLLILVGVGLLGNFFAATRLPFALADLVTSLGASHFSLFLAIVVAYIVLGCMMNVIPMILLTLPAIYPTIEAVGFDPIWFGVVTVVLMEMGQITPPVGINVFAISSVAQDIPMTRIFARILPFFFSMLLLVFVLYFFPGLATWLPGVLF